MPAYFFDSSAIVKRYHREPGTVWVEALCGPRVRPPIYLSHLATVEVVSALRRLGRTEGHHPTAVDAMVNMIERHVALSSPVRPNPLYLLVPITPPIMALAAELCNRHWQTHPQPLRTLDAIQLASALATAADVADELTFVTADRRLAEIAALEGFHVINPAHPSQS